MDRNGVIEKLDDRVKNFLDEMEDNTGLKLIFQELSGDSKTVAEYGFDPLRNLPTIYLKNGWSFDFC